MASLLLVEDNELNRDMLSRRLVRRGHSVSFANDGAAAVEAAAKLRPDLILMDMGLPVIDGWEATRRIKANPDLCGIPIIALTAHAMRGASDDAQAAGCDEFETKPVEFDRLLAKIERLVAARTR